MEDIQWLIRKYAVYILCIFILVIPGVWLWGKKQKESESALIGAYGKENQNLEAENEKECNMVMRLVADIYISADKGDASNVILSDDVVQKMVIKLGETGYPVIGNHVYSNMCNYSQVDYFLEEAELGNRGEVVIYEIYSDGGVGREKFVFDGTDMYVMAARYSWDSENQIVLTNISHTKIREWRYADNGWFCYELCVPEYPEVTEMVDGSCLMRVLPISDENRKLSEKVVLGLGYQGNNLLCSNWDTTNMEALDYNGMFEYLYSMKYQKRFDADKYSNGIPKDEFENLIMEYLPISVEQIRMFAAFDEENQTYVWGRLGCFNYAPTFFGTSVPEVTDVRENEDGTITLTVNAVCEMVLCDEAVITHELTIRFAEDGSFQYLGNKILNDGIEMIPDYQYRISRSND